VRCLNDAQCAGANEVCDTDINDCVCDTRFERCPLVGGACVDTQTDPAYCGECDIACGSGQVCQSGACFDPSDCRIDGIDCSGLTYCDPSTGACVRCLNDAQCGATNEVCDTDINACVCRSGFERCPPIFGLCVDTQTDVRYCGNCQTACGTGEVCQFGACFDPSDCRTNGIGCSGLTYCDPSTGVCMPGCDNNMQCTVANEICNVTFHACVCGSGFERCGTECVDCSGFSYCDPIAGVCLPGCANDAQCGENEVCELPTHTCVCDFPPFERCFGLCVNTQIDLANCGACGNACGIDQFCFDGECFGTGL
jgi:hypothetical protein